MMKLILSMSDNGKPREAIPVRAVPLVTDGFISAEEIAIALAGEGWSLRHCPTAHIQSDGELKTIPPSDWRLIADQLQALNASLPEGKPGKYEWLHRSIAEIPAAAFLWADEFADAYRKSFNNAIHLEHSEGETLHANGEVRIPMVVSDQLRCVALEGFPDIPVGVLTAPASNNPMVPDSPTTQTICAELQLCLEKQQPISHEAPTLSVNANDATPVLTPQNWGQPPKSIDKERGCRRLIRENWDEIKKLYGQNPDGRQVLRVIKRHLDKDQSPPVIKTVQNKLAQLRGENLIP